MTVTQSLVGLNHKTLLLCFIHLIHMDQLDMVKPLLSWLEFFLCLDLWFLIQFIPSQKKIQTIGIQSRPGLKKQKNYDGPRLFLDMD
jgi:hypothetical protein